MTTSTHTDANAVREKRSTAVRGTVPPAKSEASSAARPPSQRAAASRWATSRGMASQGWIPADACSAIAQVAASPAATTKPPIPSPYARLRRSPGDARSSSSRAYEPNSTARKTAAALSRSSRDSSAAPGLVASASPSSVRSGTAPSPLPLV